MWVAWRQHRAALMTFAVIIVAAAAYLAYLGVRMHASIGDLGLDACAAPAARTCPGAAAVFRDSYSGIPVQLQALALIPPLLAMLVGAPLVAQELERGTQRLAWMQSVSRRRWLLVKVSLVMAFVGVGLLVVGMLVQWCCGPLVSAGMASRLEPLIFTTAGIVPAAYGALALSIGVASGALLGRLLPAMVVALVVFLFVLVAAMFLRPHYAPSTTLTQPATSLDLVMAAAPIQQGMLISSEFVTANGVSLGRGASNTNMPALRKACADVGKPFDQSENITPDPSLTAITFPSDDCARLIGLTRVTQYQPEDMFWRFQLTEFVLLAVASVLFLAAALRRVTRLDT